jgi:hypothetical protein
MSTEQLTITEPKVTHAWVTFYEDAGERRQRKVECLRSERGLAITWVSHEVYTFTHVPSGKRFTDGLSDKRALAIFDDVLALSDWTAESPPGLKRADLVRLGLVTT